MRSHVLNIVASSLLLGLAVSACSVKATDEDGNIPGTNIDPNDIAFSRFPALPEGMEAEVEVVIRLRKKRS